MNKYGRHTIWQMTSASITWRRDAQPHCPMMMMKKMKEETRTYSGRMANIKEGQDDEHNISEEKAGYVDMENPRWKLKMK